MLCFPLAQSIVDDPQPPIITQGLDDLRVQDGDSARLECSVDGCPKPEILWFREATLIQPSPDFLQFYDADNLCSLVIREVFPEDTGRYTMVAKNMFGTATCSTEIMVEENSALQPPGTGQSKGLQTTVNLAIYHHLHEMYAQFPTFVHYVLISLAFLL